MKYIVKNLSKTEVEFEIEISPEDFNKAIDKTIEELGKDIEIKGFRKGKAPKNVIEEHFGSEKILIEAADKAVSQAYSEAVKESKVKAILKPEVEIKKMAKGDVLMFIAKTAILPDIELPDYKDIASKIKRNKVEVKDEDVQKTLDWLQKSRAKMILKNDKAEKGDFVQIEYIIEGKTQKDGFILGQGHFVPGFEDNLIGMKAGEEKEIEIEKGKIKTKIISVNTMELAEINDEFAKSLGSFENLESLKNNIKEGITQEKEQVETQRVRNEALDKIIEKIKIDLPQPLLKQEKDQMFRNLKEQVKQRMQISFEEYLKKVKKTEEDILKPLEKEAEKKLKVFMVLREIGEKENVQVSDQEITEEVDKILKRYPTIEEAEKDIDLESFKNYTREVIKNEKIFKILCP